MKHPREYLEAVLESVRDPPASPTGDQRWEAGAGYIQVLVRQAVQRQILEAEEHERLDKQAYRIRQQGRNRRKKLRRKMRDDGILKSD